MMYRSLSFWGKLGSSLTAKARLVSGPRATKETCGGGTCYWYDTREQPHTHTHTHTHRDTHTDRQTEPREGSHLLLVFSDQSNHCTDGVLFLDLLLPARVCVFDHIPESISSKVVTNGFTGSNQRSARTSKHWNLQGKQA